MLTASMLPLRMLGLLMLLSALCDADSSCPTELILDPPEVLAEYGKSVMVNCTNEEDIYDGIYWKVGDKDSPVEFVNSVSQSLPLLDWNVTAQCKIKLNSTHECSKDLEITLYKNPEAVNLFPTKHVAAVEGKPYELQCDVDEVAPVQHLIVRWYRGNETIKTDYSTQPNATKRIASESFTLAANFSRGENGTRFRCEARLDFGQRGSRPPVISNAHTVSVHYAPELKNKTEDVSVNEGDYITLDCGAEGYPAPAFNWSRDGVNLLETTNDLNVTLATSAIYDCTATNYLGNVTKQIHVHAKKTNIMEAPAAMTTPEPSTSRSCPLVLTPAKIAVRFGDPASVNCSTSATEFLQIGWEAISGGMTSKEAVVTWTVEKVKDWDTKPLCYIDVNDGQCSIILDITLYKTPDSVSVSASDRGPMVEGTEYRLQCDITNVAPVQKLKLTWYRGGETVHTQMFNDTRKTPGNVSSTLRVTPARDHNGVLFRCEAELRLGLNGSERVPNVTSSSYMAVVHYKPLVKSCPVSYAGVEHEFSIDRLSCEADGNPPPTIQWYHEEELINASKPLTRTQSGEYTAKITNSLGSSNFSVLISIEYGPSFTCAAHPEVKEDDTFQCEADGIPKPVVTWFKRGQEVAAPRRWTKSDHGTYSLQAANKHGQATHELHVVVLYAPVFGGSYSAEVDVILGKNVTFNCVADGHPPPEIKWSYSSEVNVTEATKGRQKSISVTRATSTDAGVYICDATNKVGVSRRTVTLVVKDRPKQKAMMTIWWVLIVLAILLILILIIFCYRWKKQGQYTFIPEEANNCGSGIPLTPQANGV
ncbi:intercellular adhesion molecule 5 [Cyclopterus lumpus]|uniref:Ig-like domain-containing protein n=1 Tax=Cyclopterus lumpus TaxID=8103 RepID=A0A8C2ZQP7_CYCLU|nr:intercellular adhesion molecule 5 [Cyclopterus lumpus]